MRRKLRGLTLLGLVMALIVAMGTTAIAGSGLQGRWHRLNPAPNASGDVFPEHDTLTGNGSSTVVRCRYNKLSPRQYR